MQPTVLFGILNWGLGHATRSMPIINFFHKNNFNVIIASDGEALEFLKKEYPSLKFYELPGYNVKYPYKSIIINILLYAFKIIKAIAHEYIVTKKIIEAVKPNLIISDNRYGFRSPKVKSIIISHQINLELGNAIISKVGTWFNRILLKKFNKLWIPDFSGNKGLAGKLSNVNKSINHDFIGPLSRFYLKKSKLKYDIAIVLSGPEPQRTKLEKILLDQLSKIKSKIIFIRGKVLENDDYNINPNFLIKSYALSQELNEIINQSELVISRSGYSTLMDLAVLGKKAIFIPTPGQTEQEYLAEYLCDEKIYYSETQDKFDLEKALEQIKNYKGLKVNYDLLESIILNEINSIRK